MRPSRKSGHAVAGSGTPLVTPLGVAHAISPDARSGILPALAPCERRFGILPALVRKAGSIGMGDPSPSTPGSPAIDV
jgi:hypothetical protein